MRTILVVGGGYAGFYTAWKLEKKVRRDEAQVVVVDPRPYMTYQPFLPEVLAGSVEPRHAAVSLRRHLHRTRLIAGMVTAIDHAHRNATVQPADGPAFTLGYDIIVVTAGAVTRKLAIPGVAEQAIGLKHVEEAVAIRDRLLTAFDQAAALPPGPRRQRLLTVTFAGGGFSGVEGFGELLSLATSLVRRYPELSPAELRFHLVEARDRILPEVSDQPGRWVVRSLEKRGAVRQGKLLAKNIVATLRGRKARPYVHHSLGTVATLGLGRGIFEYRHVVIKGLPAWLMHRGYHVLAVPSWERKIRVLAVWLTAAVSGRDIVSLAAAQDPRRAFVTGDARASPPGQPPAPLGYARAA